MSSSNLVRVGYKKESVYGVTQAAVKASKVIQDLTYTAVKGGVPGNSITIQYVNTATAGAETCVVTGNAIVVGIQSGVSTATQVRTRVNATAAAIALVSVVVSGTGGTAQVTASATNLLTGADGFKTARFVSEKYSGTPATTESAQIRTDRLSSGQVVTGLTVAGGHNFELAKELAIEDFMESAMFNAWNVLAAITRDVTMDADLKTLTAGSGSFINDGLVIGDIITPAAFVNAGNNVPLMLTDVTATVLTFAAPTGLVDEVGSGTSIKRADKLSIGTTKKSLTVEKAFTDLTTKAIVYRGMLVSQMNLDVAYGALISGSFELSGNGYAPADSAAEFASYQEYIDDPATTSTLNGSVDMPFVMTDVTGTFEQDTLCIQSLKLSLANNLSVQTCIGRAAPENYNPGTAQIKVDLSSYLKDANWDFLARKLSQASFAIGFLVKNTGGWYGFYMPAIQVSFDDPASGGQNQDVSMAMSGTAKVGDNDESALTIYRS